MARAAGSGAKGPASRGHQPPSVSGPARSASFLKCARALLSVEAVELRGFLTTLSLRALLVRVFHTLRFLMQASSLEIGFGPV